MTDQYVAGSCNIGPAEIAIRRRAGHVGLAVTAGLATALLRSDLHRAWRLTLAVPAAGAAAGYLQARQRFCADFGFRGVYNFDRRGHEQRVTSDQARLQDRRRAGRIAATSAAVGLGVALVSMSFQPRSRIAVAWPVRSLRRSRWRRSPRGGRASAPGCSSR